MLSDQTLRRLFRSQNFVDLFGDLIRWLVYTAIAIVIALYVAYFALLAHHMFFGMYMNDFGKFYYSAGAFVHGQDMYAPNPATRIAVSETEVQQFGNMNPPHFQLLMAPLAYLSPLAALLIWTALSAVALMASVSRITSELRVPWTRRGVVASLAALLFCAATAINVVTGQLTFLLMLPVTLAWIAARRGNWYRSAIYLGICAAIKPFLAIFLPYFIVKRHVKAAALMMLAAAAFFAVGVVICGWQTYVDWSHTLSQVTWPWAPMNGSIEGILSRALGHNPAFRPIVYLPDAIKPATLIVSLSIAASCIIALARDHTKESVDRVFAVLLILALVASPLGWIYYIWLAAGPVFALWYSHAGQKTTTSWRILQGLAIAGLASPLFLTLIGRKHLWGGVTFGSIYSWTLLVLLVMLLVDMRHRTAES